jgi:hypothetical protein
MFKIESRHNHQQTNQFLSRQQILWVLKESHGTQYLSVATLDNIKN